jgi:hypothetical protein
MKKTMSIDIAGQLFRIDEDAYELLARYLQHVADSFRGEQGGEETIADIETRIAEIFGGGQEPPIVVTKEMISEMINIMGAPEDYYSGASDGKGIEKGKARKSMYNPNSFSAQIRNGLSVISKAFGKFFYMLFRIFMIITGSAFTLFGFAMLFSFVLMLFFNSTPLVKDLFNPEMVNVNTLLSIVLQTEHVWIFIILSALVIMIPLSALTYLGIKMVFNIKGNSKIFSLIMFVAWFISAAVLGVILSARLTTYSNHDSISKNIPLTNPPDTLYLAPGRTVSSLTYDEICSVDQLSFFRVINPETIYGTVDLNISRPDSIESYIAIEKRAHGHSNLESYQNVRNIDYNYKFSGDTLYLDEFYSVKPGEKWNGSEIKIWIVCPQGTIIKCVPGSNADYWGLWHHKSAPVSFKIAEWGYDEIPE